MCKTSSDHMVGELTKTTHESCATAAV